MNESRYIEKAFRNRDIYYDVSNPNSHRLKTEWFIWLWILAYWEYKQISSLNRLNGKGILDQIESEVY